MIHSLSGGVVRDKKYYDFAKVQLDSGEILWYISNIFNLKEGNRVIVPLNGERKEAVVLRIDKSVSEQVAPISPKRAKEILEVVNK